MSQSDAMYRGNSHDTGGIKVVVEDTAIDTKEHIEVEGLEYKICRDAYDSNIILDFPPARNKKVLDYIHQEFSCQFIQPKAESQDFIICKKVVFDPTPKRRKGTVKEILNEMQGEGGCKVVDEKETKFSEGGRIINEYKGVKVGEPVIYTRYGGHREMTVKRFEYEPYNKTYTALLEDKNGIERVSAFNYPDEINNYFIKAGGKKEIENYIYKGLTDFFAPFGHFDVVPLKEAIENNEPTALLTATYTEEVKDGRSKSFNPKTLDNKKLFVAIDLKGNRIELSGTAKYLDSYEQPTESDSRYYSYIYDINVSIAYAEPVKFSSGGKLDGKNKRDHQIVNDWLAGKVKELGTAENENYRVVILDEGDIINDGQVRRLEIYINKKHPELPVTSGYWMNWWEEDFKKYFDVSEREYKRMTIPQRAKLEAGLQIKLWVDQEFWMLFAKFYYPQIYNQWWEGEGFDLDIEPSNEYWKERFKWVGEKKDEDRKLPDLNPSSRFFVEQMITRKLQRHTLKKSNPKFEEQMSGIQDAIDKGYLYTGVHPLEKDTIYVRPTKKLSALYFSSGGAVGGDSKFPDEINMRINSGENHTVIAFRGSPSSPDKWEIKAGGQLGMGIYFSCDQKKAAEYGNLYLCKIKLMNPVIAGDEISYDKIKEIFYHDADSAFTAYCDEQIFFREARSWREIGEAIGRATNQKYRQVLFVLMSIHTGAICYEDGFEICLLDKNAFEVVSAEEGFDLINGRKPSVKAEPVVADKKTTAVEPVPATTANLKTRIKIIKGMIAEQPADVMFLKTRLKVLQGMLAAEEEEYGSTPQELVDQLAGTRTKQKFIDAIRRNSVYGLAAEKTAEVIGMKKENTPEQNLKLAAEYWKGGRKRYLQKKEEWKTQSADFITDMHVKNIMALAVKANVDLEAEIAEYDKDKNQRKENVIRHYQYDFKIAFLKEHNLPVELIDNNGFKEAWSNGVLSDSNNLGLNEIAPELIPDAIKHPQKYIEAKKKVNTEFGSANGYIKETEKAKAELLKLLNGGSQTSEAKTEYAYTQGDGVIIGAAGGAWEKAIIRAPSTVKDGVQIWLTSKGYSAEDNMLPAIFSAKQESIGGGYKAFKGLGGGKQYVVVFNDGYSFNTMRASDRNDAINEAARYRLHEVGSYPKTKFMSEKEPHHLWKETFDPHSHETVNWMRQSASGVNAPKKLVTSLILSDKLKHSPEEDFSDTYNRIIENPNYNAPDKIITELRNIEKEWRKKAYQNRNAGDEKIYKESLANDYIADKAAEAITLVEKKTLVHS